MTSPNQKLPTLLLATLAGWSLIVAICVYAGLGGRYSLHPDDASRVPELPRLDLSRRETAQQLAEYAMAASGRCSTRTATLAGAGGPNAGDATGAPVLVPLA